MRDRLRAVVLAAALLGWSAVTPRIPQRWQPVPQAAFGTAAAVLTRGSLGFAPAKVGKGLRWGTAAAATVAAAVGGATAVPAVRAAMAARPRPAAAARWLTLRIPFGTVWSEEAGYRAALGTLAARAFGPSAGRWLTAAVFGLSHLPDARAAGESVAGTVLVTGTAGWVFGWLYDKTGSLAAPILAHLAVNEAGAVAALAVQRRQGAVRT